MKHIFLNLKRFDISPEKGGVNRLAPMQNWGAAIVSGTQEALAAYDPSEVEFVMYMPEAHLLAAAAAKKAAPGAARQSGRIPRGYGGGRQFRRVHDEPSGERRGADGCAGTLIGHCEERNDKMGILAEAGVTGKAAAEAVNRILNQEIKCAQAAGLTVLYCIGEKSEEQADWENVLGAQLDIGLDGVDKSSVVIAYEPIWSIGPGKTPADKPYITKIARFVKQRTGGLDVVYGGGLKQDNAAMLASIDEIDGGLIALTRFSGEIGFYPDEYLDIIRRYLGK